MQAILTKYIPATNFKGSRIKATCKRGSITISYPDDLSVGVSFTYGSNSHVHDITIEQAEALAEKLNNALAICYSERKRRLLERQMNKAREDGV